MAITVEATRVLSRRRFVGLGLGVAAATLVCRQAWALPSEGERRLGLYNLHTGESFEGPYWAEGSYLPETLADIRRVLRDFRTGDQHDIDPRLLDTLVMLRTRLETNERFQIISGYRSPKTNAKLHEESSGVATHSYHMVGKASDIRIAGRDLAAVHKTALAMAQGGVGYYPVSNFVHVDVGPVRHW